MPQPSSVAGYFVSQTTPMNSKATPDHVQTTPALPTAVSEPLSLYIGSTLSPMPWSSSMCRVRSSITRVAPSSAKQNGAHRLPVGRPPRRAVVSRTRCGRCAAKTPMLKPNEAAWAMARLLVVDSCAMPSSPATSNGQQQLPKSAGIEKTAMRAGPHSEVCWSTRSVSVTSLLARSPANGAASPDSQAAQCLDAAYLEMSKTMLAPAAPATMHVVAVSQTGSAFAVDCRAASRNSSVVRATQLLDWTKLVTSAALIVPIKAIGEPSNG